MTTGVSTDLGAQSQHSFSGLTFQHFWNVGLVFLLIGSFWGQFMLFEQHMTDFEREIRAEVLEIKQEVATLEDGQVALRLRVTKLEAEVHHLRDDIQEVKTDTREIKQDIRQLLRAVQGDSQVAGLPTP